MVTISKCNYAGKYVLKSKKVYDIVKRAGGLTSVAIEGVKIKRPIQAKQIEAVESQFEFGKKTVSKINWRKTERRFEIRHHTCRLEVDY
jgi:hypothetical protein